MFFFCNEREKTENIERKEKNVRNEENEKRLHVFDNLYIQVLTLLKIFKASLDK